MAIKTGSAAQIGFVVKDFDTVVHQWETVLGKPTDRYSVTPDGFKQYHGREEDFAAKIAIFKLDNLDIEIICPLRGESIWKDFLEETAGGIHHIQFHCDSFQDDCKELERLFGPSSQIGPSVRGPGYHFAYFDTASALGCSLEILNSDEKFPDGHEGPNMLM